MKNWSVGTVPEDVAKNAWGRRQVFLLKCLAIGAGAAMLTYLILSSFDTTTELIPDHESISQACLMLGGLGGAVASAVALSQWKKLAIAQRVVWPPASALLVFLTLFMISSEAANVIENRIDFPAAQTKTFDGFLLISRAYCTHGKGESWNIQTMPVWSNMEITQEDYNFMLSHRPAGQNATNGDEVTSRGYFCAHVMMQRTDKALRVLHAGREKLPQGTVMVCPH